MKNKNRQTTKFDQCCSFHSQFVTTVSENRKVARMSAKTFSYFHFCYSEGLKQNLITDESQRDLDSVQSHGVRFGFDSIKPPTLIIHSSCIRK